MNIDILAADLLPFMFALVVAGLFTGFLAGIFGVGGGAILVPVFYQMFGELGVDEAVRMHLCVGTSLAIIVPTSARSLLAHLKIGDVDLELLRSWIFAVPAGVALASLVSVFISGAGLKIIFAVIIVVVGLKLLIAKDSWRLGEELPGHPLRAIVGAMIGFSSTFIGIGGGVMNNTFMTLYGRPLHQAISTSSGVGVLISIPGTIGYMLSGIFAAAGNSGLPIFSIGYVNWMSVVLIIPATLLTAPLGAYAAHALTRRHLETMFGIFLFLVAGRFLYSLWG
jgi:uncharacterized membrane protein YfcA